MGLLLATVVSARSKSMQYYEDISVGEKYELGGWTVTREEILDFAKQWDPQPFHTNEVAARESMFGRLVASGLHTMAIAIRLAYPNFYRDVAALGGLGMDEVRLPKPVYPNDTLVGHVEILEKQPMDSNVDRGIVRINYTLFRESGEQVLDMNNMIIFKRVNGM